MTPLAFGRYKVRRELGSGGMADVYLAADPVLLRDVAVKSPKPERLNSDLLGRFESEVRAVASLEHPAIVPVFDYGDEEGRPFLVMPYLPGGTLVDRLEHGSYTLDAAAPIISRIAAALDHAHAHGILHRDVKPGNILFDKPGDDGEAFLSDFGIARLAATDGEETLARRTRTGMMVGTFTYASPEQVQGHAVDHRSDIYSLGVVLFEMMAGDVPYRADSGIQQGVLHVTAAIPSIAERQPDLPAALQTILNCALAKDPAARYTRAGDLATDLRRVAAGRRPEIALGMAGAPPEQPRPARLSPWLIAVVGLIVVALAAAAVILLNRGGGETPEGTAVAVGGDPATPQPPTAVAPTVPSEATSAPTEIPAAAELAVPPATDPPVTEPAAPPTETPPTTEPTALPTVDPRPQPFTLGQTARGTPIEAVRFGNGPQRVIFVGGLSAGFAPSTVALARAAVDHFTRNPAQIPPELTVIFVLSASPDTPTAPGEYRGRLNSNGVDINRNWDCQWAADTLWRGDTKRGSGGPAPFSEAESRLLRDFIVNEGAAGVFFWQARVEDGLVSPGACGSQSLVSRLLADSYGAAADYPVKDFVVLTGQTLNGDASNWLDSVGVPAVSILLPAYNSSIDWDNNLAGMLAVFAEIAARPPGRPAVALPTALPAVPTLPVVCEIDPGPHAATLWANHRDRLGCATSGVNAPESAFQYYEGGLAIWRADLDVVYVIYDDGAFATYRADVAPEGFYESDLVKGSFGYLWRTNETVRAGLGRQLAIEKNPTAFAVQDFIGGVIFSYVDDATYRYALFTDNNTWATIR